MPKSVTALSESEVMESTVQALPETVDVLIVGAGISGIGAAYHLTTRCADKSFVLIESQDTFGGTWWTHRYPGVRSDSDLFTFGYRFKPWVGAPIASAGEILKYLAEVLEENDLERHIHYRHQVIAASWSSAEARWTVKTRNLDTADEREISAGFVWMCQGYYRHGEGYTPQWEGFDRFAGTVVHPQRWPEDLDYIDKRIVVIGSGATAATLIPAIAPEAAHVTMLQRSPTFYFVRPNTNELADTLRGLDIPDEWTHEIVRRKIVQDMDAVSRMSFESPEFLRTFLLDTIRPLLPEGFDVERHFSPSYRPWQQRIAVLPEGDLFRCIRDGQVSVVTDRIERFTEDGIVVASGEELKADIVITATGFDMSVLGDVAFSVDREQVDFAETITYRGVMFTGVPNLAYVFGYFRASWTLRADLISDFVCRLLNYMDEHGKHSVTPALRDDERNMVLGAWVDPENFNPGYLTRSLHLLPKQGDREPWRLLHEYSQEKDLLPMADLEDGALIFN
jgi:monooxygenase